MRTIRYPRALAFWKIGFYLSVILSPCINVAFASTPRDSSDVLLREYNAAMAQKQPTDRIRKLQQFAWTTPGPLRADALEVVVWEYLRVGNHARALTWANELNLADKGNALALAVICQDAERSAQLKRDQVRKMASQGQNALPRLRHPVGMSDADFAAMRRQALLMLERAGGQPTAQGQGTSTATRYHSTATHDSSAATREHSTKGGQSVANNSTHKPAAGSPIDAERMYRQARADLKQKDSNHRQDFWELARAVVLSGGTVHGRPIADEARKLYVADGGTNAGWNKFLEAAAAGNPSLAPRARFAASPSIPVASATVATKQSRTGQRGQTASLRPASVPPNSNRPSTKTRPNQGEQVWANSKMANPGIVRKTRVVTGPMSLGILIETSLTARGRRGALSGTLVDMLRRMGDDDEAFILTYDNDLVFEQDLTGDPKQLDEAMKEIQPKGGAKLDEAVAFAAGHLARIAKNPNRILLVISDGRNVNGHNPALHNSSMINNSGVRIYCIGIGVDGVDGRSHLQALSSGTGGRSDFISDSSQFRGATKQIAQNMGIDFRY